MFVFLASPGFAWRFIDSFANNANQKTPLITRLVRGETLPYFVHMRGPWDPQKLDAIFTRSFNHWRLFTLQEISAAKREKEFKDVVQKLQTPWKFEIRGYLSCADFKELPWLELSRPVLVADLPHHIEMHPTHCSVAVREDMDNFREEVHDMFVSFSTSDIAKEERDNLPGRYISWEAVGEAVAIDGETTAVYTTSYNNALFVPLQESNSLFHEMGHLLGFADQYPTYEDDVESVEYGLSGQWPSIMQNSAEMKDLSFFSCTDADGMINLLDFVAHKSRGGKKGWKTLCLRESIQYANSRQLNRPAFVAPPYVYFYDAAGKKLYRRQEKPLRSFAQFPLPWLPYVMALQNWKRQPDGTWKVTDPEFDMLEFHLHYTPISVSVWGENLAEKQISSVSSLIFLPSGSYVYWQDPWYGVMNGHEITQTAWLGDSLLVLRFFPDIPAVGFGIAPRAESRNIGEGEDPISMFLVFKFKEDDSLVLEWIPNPSFPEYDTYLKYILKLFGNELNDKVLRKNTRLMSLLAIIGNGVENTDWEKIGRGLLNDVLHSGLDRLGAFRTKEVLDFLIPLNNIKLLCFNEELLKDSWAEVFATGTPAALGVILKQRDKAYESNYQEDLPDFYPTKHPLRACVWHP